MKISMENIRPSKSQFSIYRDAPHLGPAKPQTHPPNPKMNAPDICDPKHNSENVPPGFKLPGFRPKPLVPCNRLPIYCDLENVDIPEAPCKLAEEEGRQPPLKGDRGRQPFKELRQPFQELDEVGGRQQSFKGDRKPFKEARQPFQELENAPRKRPSIGVDVPTEEESQGSQNEDVDMLLDQSCSQESMEQEEASEEELEEDDSILEDSMIILHREETEFVLDSQEYKHEIYKHVSECQKKYKPKWNYMTKQPDITFNMRSILVDWLVEVGEEYKLNNETIYLAVNYIDRFLSQMAVQRAKLQLVGAACMFIASKYEEIYPPEASEFVYITDDTYSRKQVLRMEQLVLKVLNFELCPPTTFFFLTQFAKETKSDDRSTFLAMYLSELSMLDAETYLHYDNNVVAAAAVALARHTCGIAAWPENVIEFSGLDIDDFKECLINMHSTFSNAADFPQQAIIEKYKALKYLNVANIDPTPIS